MISIDRFLSDEQDPKAVEKVIPKLLDLLTSGEELLYMAVQKKPAVNLFPVSIVVSNRRMFYCESANLGLTMNFKDISWKNIKEVSFKEEFFGARFICVPNQGENILTDYIPKLQARKLYQAALDQLENQREQARVQQLEAHRPSPLQVQFPLTEPPALEDPTLAETEDELTIRLRKLKSLYDKQLITPEEYDTKKAEILKNL